MSLHGMLGLCLPFALMLQPAHATGGAVHVKLERFLKEYQVSTVLVGEVRGFERAIVRGSKPLDETKADETRFAQYSYLRLIFRAVPSQALRGTVEAGRPIRLTFQEHDFDGQVALRPDGTTKDTGPTALGIISSGSGEEREGYFCQLGRKGVFFLVARKGEPGKELLRIERADEATLGKIQALLKER